VTVVFQCAGVEKSSSSCVRQKSVALRATKKIGRAPCDQKQKEDIYLLAGKTARSATNFRRRCSRSLGSPPQRAYYRWIAIVEGYPTHYRKCPCSQKSLRERPRSGRRGSFCRQPTLAETKLVARSATKFSPRANLNNGAPRAAFDTCNRRVGVCHARNVI